MSRSSSQIIGPAFVNAVMKLRRIPWLAENLFSASFMNDPCAWSYHCLLSHLCRVFTCNKPSSYGIQFCSYSVVTNYATCNVISHIECFVLLHQYFRSRCAVPNVAVVCSSLCSASRVCRSGIVWMILSIVPFTATITDMFYVSTFQLTCISVLRS